MNKLTAAGICIGILAGLWFWASSVIPLLVGVAGFFAYASFYAAGGGLKGFKSSLTANFSGVFWAVVSVYLGMLLDNLFHLGLGASIIATMICSAFVVWQAHIKWFGFIPGAFFGMTSYFASGNELAGTLISLAIGACVGLLSEVSGDKLYDLIGKKPAEEN